MVVASGVQTLAISYFARLTGSQLKPHLYQFCWGAYEAPFYHTWTKCTHVFLSSLDI